MNPRLAALFAPVATAVALFVPGGATAQATFAGAWAGTPILDLNFFSCADPAAVGRCSATGELGGTVDASGTFTGSMEFPVYDCSNAELASLVRANLPRQGSVFFYLAPDGSALWFASMSASTGGWSCQMQMHLLSAGRQMTGLGNACFPQIAMPECHGDGTLRIEAATPSPVANYSDLWWNPAESGWGLTIADHGTQLFAVWYTYTHSGKPVWYVMPGGTFSADRRIFDADLYVSSGPPYTSMPFRPDGVSSQKIGTARFDFAPAGLSAGRATFTYSIAGATQTRQIERQSFGSGAPTWKSDYTDMWWNPAESGWGLALAQHGNNVFGVLFTYGADRQPLWITLPGARFEGASWFQGPIYTATGPSFDNPVFDPARVVATQIGTAAFSFGGDSGTFSHTTGGTTVSRAIVRQSFGGSDAPSCAAAGGICIASVSPMSVSPMEKLSVHGAGFDPLGSAISVRFILSNGDPPIEVPAMYASPTLVEAAAPPRSGQGVEVQVIQASTAVTLTSNRMPGIAIAALQPGPTPAGHRTAAFLRVAAALAPDLEARARAKGLASLGDSLHAYQRRTAALAEALGRADSSGALVPLADGTFERVDAAALANADMLSNAVLRQLYDALPAQLKSTKLMEGCPVSAQDPVGNDSFLCALERAWIHLGELDGDVRLGFRKIAFGIGLSLVAEEAEVAFSVSSLVLAGVTAFIPPAVFDGRSPERMDFAVSIGGEVTAWATGVKHAGRGVGAVYDSINVMRDLSQYYPPSPILLKHSLVMDDGRGNSYVITSDGSHLARIPDLPGSYDSTQLVVAPDLPQECTYTYGDWSACVAGAQGRSVLTSTPPGCVGSPIVAQSCVSQPPPSGQCSFVSCVPATPGTLFDPPFQCMCSSPTPSEGACNTAAVAQVGENCSSRLCVAGTVCASTVDLGPICMTRAVFNQTQCVP